jgi:molybdate transport system substrate-binding protein
MDQSSIAAVTLLTLAIAVAPAASARAAELKVLAGGSITASLKELAPKFEKATGHRLDITFAATPELIKMATTAPFDLGIVPTDVMKNEAARATFAGTPAPVTRVGFGVAVKAGAVKPDLATPDAMKAALLAAKSVTFLPESAAGAYVLKVFERLGIAEAMKAKTRAQTVPAKIVEAVASGEAELGIFLTNVLIGPGVELAGPFPGDLQQEFVLVGAVAAGSKENAAAQAFLDYLKTPEAAAVFRSKGVTPG